MLAAGWSSTLFSDLSKPSSHSSNCVSFEKSASTAPAFVPVARKGEPAPGDHAKVAVLGISHSLTISKLGVLWVAAKSLIQVKQAIKGLVSSRNRPL